MSILLWFIKRVFTNRTYMFTIIPIYKGDELRQLIKKSRDNSVLQNEVDDIKMI